MMINLRFKLTYMILICVAASFFVAVYAQDWASAFANLTAFMGWYAVLGYEKREARDEALSR